MVIMCSIGISSSRKVMEKLKSCGKARTWFLFTARLDAGARFVCTLLIQLRLSSNHERHGVNRLGCGLSVSSDRNTEQMEPLTHSRRRHPRRHCDASPTELRRRDGV